MSTSNLIRLAIITLVIGCIAQQVQAFSKPTDAELDAMLAHPSTIKKVLQGATTNEAADVVLRSIAKIQAVGLSDEQEKQAIALLVGYAVDAMGSAAPGMVAAVVMGVDAKLLPLIVAAAVTVAADPAAILAAVVAALGPDSAGAAAARAAAATPAEVLGERLADLLLRTLRPGATIGGSVVPLPPAGGTPSEPIIPPPLGRKYKNQ